MFRGEGPTLTALKERKGRQRPSPTRRPISLPSFVALGLDPCSPEGRTVQLWGERVLRDVAAFYHRQRRREEAERMKLV